MDKMLVVYLLFASFVLSFGCMPKKDAVNIHSEDLSLLVTSSFDFIPMASDVYIAHVNTVSTNIADNMVPAVQTVEVTVPAVQVSPVAVQAVQVAPMMIPVFQVAQVMVPAVQIPSAMVPTVQITPLMVPSVQAAPDASPADVDIAMPQPIDFTEEAVASEEVEPVTTEAGQSTVILPQIDAEPVVLHATNVIGEVGHNFDDDYYLEDYDNPTPVISHH